MTTPAEATATTQRPTYCPSHVRRDGDCVVLTIPMVFRRRNGRREIILPQGADGTAAAQSEPNRPLAVALARAWHWQEMLDSNQVGSVDELANRLHLDPTYVARILRLTALTPGLVEAVLSGEEPDGLSQRKLSAKLPLNWHEQQQLFGSPMESGWAVVSAQNTSLQQNRQKPRLGSVRPNALSQKDFWRLAGKM